MPRAERRVGHVARIGKRKLDTRGVNGLAPHHDREIVQRRARKKDRLKRSLRNGGPKSTRRNGASHDPERFPKGAAPESKLDDDRTAFEAAKSAVAAAEMQAAAQAAIGQAPSRWLARMRPSRPPRRRSKPISTTAS